MSDVTSAWLAALKRIFQSAGQLGRDRTGRLGVGAQERDRRAGPGDQAGERSEVEAGVQGGMMGVTRSATTLASGSLARR